MEVSNFKDLHEILQSHKQDITIYRGVKSISYELIPKIGRSYYQWNHTNVYEAEEYIFQIFKRKSMPFIHHSYASDWDWLALSQHFGLPTRLLDWTRNPLIACYFSVHEETAEDSVLYIFSSQEYPVDINKNKNPFEYKDTAKFIPSYNNERIIAQSGVFTIHPNPIVPFDSNEISKIIIKKKFRKELKMILYKYGIHEFSVFPCLDALANHIIWERSKSY